ncbi:MAG: F0F1 ATP synthase subunit B [Chloroflexi bacterium]|nr:F0F1 ATP synthase subunit B [Chloroflexota bacterium]
MEALGLSGKMLITQIVNFAILLGVLWLLLYKPILNALKQRQEKIRESLAQADSMRQEARNTEQQFEQELQKARKEGQEIIARAQEMAEKTRQEILEQSRQEAQQLVEKAKEEIDYDRKQAMAELQKQVANLSLLVTQKVVGEALDASTHHRLVQEFIAEAGELQ